MKPIRLSILLTLCALSACTAIPNAPQDMANIPLPAAWAHAPNQASTAQTALSAQWWTAFNDPELNRLINTALTHNSNLAVAALNLQKALLQTDSATANLLPQLSASASGSSSKSLEGGASTRRFGANGGVSFQLDLFGKLLKTRDMQQWLAQASAEDRHNVELSVTTQTASLYWPLAALNRQITLSDQNLRSAQKLLDMVQVKYRAGAAAQMDVLSAEQNLRTQQSSAAALEHTRNQTRAALAVLVGEMPEARYAEQADLPDITLPELPAELPATVLDNRPDVRAARMRMMADMTSVSVSVRDFFPVLNLSAGASGGEAHLSEILSDPVGSLALNVLLPFLNMPQNAINLKVSQVQYQSDLAQYRNTLYTALSEVENAASQYTQLSRQNILLKQNLAAAQQLEQIREVRYRVGADALQNLLDAQSNTRSAELDLLQNRLALYQNFLTRYSALGGVNLRK